MTMTERGRIVRKGMGGFLNPPTHPEHDWSVETDLRRRPENRGSMSLGSTVDAAWLDDATRQAARKRLEDWQPPALDSPEVRDWIAQVLGYFRNSYRGDGPEPKCWHVGNLKFPREGDTRPPLDNHAGVHFIRKFYPEYEPSDADFASAYWGQKPTDTRGA